MESPLHILLVDDDPALVSAGRAFLSRRGCHLDSAFSGLEAVARVREGGIDAVLLDVWMPDIDGLSTLEEISRLPNPPRVVLMSGHIDVKVEEAVSNGRALACLLKPVNFDLALTLLAGEAPDHPLSLRIALDLPSLLSFSHQALTRGLVFLDDAPQLPPQTPISLVLELPSGQLTLLGVADPAARPTGKRGLGLRLADLTEAQQQSLSSIQGIHPENPPVQRNEACLNRAHQLYRRGLEKLERKEYDAALLEFRAARDLNPSDVLLAAAALRAGELAGIEKSRQLFRDSQKVSEPSEALRLVEEAIRLDSSQAAYYREAARLYLHLGDAIPQAEERLAAAIHLSPSDPEPRLHLVQLLERAGRPKEALWACESAMSLFPNDPELLKMAARLKRKVAKSVS